MLKTGSQPDWGHEAFGVEVNRLALQGAGGERSTAQRQHGERRQNFGRPLEAGEQPSGGTAGVLGPTTAPLPP
jgi:hypothetical protein